MAAQVRRVLFQVSLVAFLALALGVGQAAHASLIAYETFDTYSAGSLVGANGGSGWGGAWTTGGTVIGSGLAFSDYAVGMRSAQITMSSWTLNFDTQASRPFGASASAGSTLWVSFVGQWDSGSHYTGNELRVGPSATGSTGQFDIQPRNGSTNWWNWTSAAVDGQQTGGYNNANGSPTYLYVAQFTNVGGVGTETLWVLSAANYDAIKAGGITETELNTNTATVSGASAAMTLDTTKYLQLAIKGNTGDWPSTFTVDEIKYGTTVGDVTSPVPEPATMALLGLGAVAMMAKRRRR
jgi:hypothetical protein